MPALINGAVMTAVKEPSCATVTVVGTVVTLLPAKVMATVSPPVYPEPESLISVSAGPLEGEITMLAPVETTIKPSGTARAMVLVLASSGIS
jgi:hypothetical protein